MSEKFYYCHKNGNYYSEYDLDDLSNQENIELFELWECDESFLPKFDLYDAIYNHAVDYVEIDDPLPQMKCIQEMEDKINEYIRLNFRHNKENKDKVLVFKNGEWVKKEVSCVDCDKNKKD